MMAAIGLLAKLVQRKGGQVDIALFDTLLSQLNYLASAFLNAGEVAERRPCGAHSIFVPAQIFRTRDGYIALFITHDCFWRKFADTVGRPDWLNDDRFAAMGARSENREVVVDSVQTELLRRTSADWVDRLRSLGIVIAATSRLEDALTGENAAARRMVVSICTPAGKLRLVGNPIKVDGFQETFHAPPRLGEDGVLLQRLGDGP
jgi:CoA:oxalate CoA-transferase